MAMTYFCCYYDYARKIARLTDEQVGRLFRALLEYGETGIKPDIDFPEGVAFDFIADDIDRSREKYDDLCESRRGAGKKGGRPRSTEQPDEETPNDEKAKKPNAFSKTNCFSENQMVFSESKKSKKTYKEEEQEYEEELRDIPLYPPLETGEPDADAPVSTTEAPQDGKDDGFDTFWDAYPKKVGKEPARKAFKKVKEPLETLLSAIERQKCSDQWREGAQFIPNPATWLNQARWEDDLPTTKGGTNVRTGTHTTGPPDTGGTAKKGKWGWLDELDSLD